VNRVRLAPLEAGVLLMVTVVAAQCGAPTPAGYWEGKGRASEVPMQDRFRQLSRSADFEFWFVVDKQRNATGEIELRYDSTLTVDNLPSASAGSVSFSPKVGGKITDLDPRRTFPLVGVLDNDGLTLAIATPEAQRQPIEFTIRADPGVSAGLGPVTLPGGAAGIGEKDVIRIPMKPFTPFNGAGKVEKRPSGPFAARFDARGGNWAIEWSARQMGGEQRKIERTPEMQDALRKLRQQVGR
jgi:hypothetical protein